jgi:hypothetical protein
MEKNRGLPTKLGAKVTVDDKQETAGAGEIFFFFLFLFFLFVVVFDLSPSLPPRLG